MKRFRKELIGNWLFRRDNDSPGDPRRAAAVNRFPLFRADSRDPDNRTIGIAAFRPDLGHCMRRAQRHERRQKPACRPSVHRPQYGTTKPRSIPLSNTCRHPHYR